MRTDWLYHPAFKIALALFVGFMIWVNACST